MTTIEWILIIEIVIFAVLSITLVLMLLNNRKGSAYYRNNQNRIQGRREYYPSDRYNPGTMPSSAPGYYYVPSPYPSGQNKGWNASAGSMPWESAGGYNVPRNYGQDMMNMYGRPVYYVQEYGEGGIPASMESSMNPDLLKTIPDESPFIYSQGANQRNRKSRGADSKSAQPNYGDRHRADRSYSAGCEKTAFRRFDSRERSDGKRGRWKVNFVEMSSGRKITRDFQDALVVGRQMPGPLESGRLYLSMDATVSRSQFCLYEDHDSIMIENLSRVNITKKNGIPIWEPVRLEEGDVLELGRMRYMVKDIRRAS